MINTVDKGSKVILQTEMADETSQPKFKRMYVRFNAQKVGFLGGCRVIYRFRWLSHKAQIW